MATNIDYSIHYRRWHKDSIDHFEAVSNTYGKLLSPVLYSIPLSAKILDYGCGSGLLTYFLTKRFEDVIGVDASSQQVETGKKIGLPIELLKICDFKRWCESKEQIFDVIFLFDVLEHVPVSSQIDFLRELVKTLKTDGNIYIKVPNANSLLASRWRYIDWTHHSSFTECSLDFVCLNSGLTNLQYLDDESSLQPSLPWFPRWGLRQYYVKIFFRKLWKIYLKSELGSQADSINVGYNLLLQASKT